MSRRGVEDEKDPLVIGIVGIIALLTVLGLSLVVTRLATIALTMTGLSYDAARFQARSAFTGTGFTTSESEKVVNHPVRRRILMLLMIFRSAGVMTIVISLILSFVGPAEDVTKLWRLVWIVAGVAVLWAISLSRVLNRGLGRVVGWALRRWTNLDVHDFVSLLRLSDDYRVDEVQVSEGDWLAGRTLADCDLHEEGVIVLGVLRSDGSYVGAPRGTTEIYPDDTLILYGRAGVLEELDQRRRGVSGDAAHRQAVDEQHEKMAEQDRQERAHRRKRQAAEQADRAGHEQQQAESEQMGESVEES